MIFRCGVASSDEFVESPVASFPGQVRMQHYNALSRKKEIKGEVRMQHYNALSRKKEIKGEILSMTNRGRRRLRGSSSRPPLSTPDEQIGGASEDDVIMTDDGLSPQPTLSLVGGTPSSLPSGGTPSSLPSASMPTAPHVAPTAANPYHGLMFLPNGAYYRHPGFADPPSPPERPANETRLEL